jgi:hypothetical protein
MVIIALCDSEGYSVNPGFEYSATNINRRDAEFPRDVEIYPITSTLRLAHFLLSK